MEPFTQRRIAQAETGRNDSGGTTTRPYGFDAVIRPTTRSGRRSDRRGEPSPARWLRWVTGARSASPCAEAGVGPSERLSANCGGAVGLATNGARCEPDCKNTALIMMMRLAAAAPMIATESTGRRASLPHIRPTNIAIRPTNTAPRLAPRSLRLRLRTMRPSGVMRQFRIAGPAKLRGLSRDARSGAEKLFQSTKFRVGAQRPTISRTSGLADALPFFCIGSCQMRPKRTLNVRTRSTPESRAKASVSLEARGIARHGEREIAA